MLRDNPAVCLLFRVGESGAGGTITVFVPQRLLLRRASDMPSTAAGTDWAPRIEGELMRSTVTLEAAMPLSRLTLGVVSEWQVGAVVAIDADAPSAVRLSARGRSLFTCEFGRAGQTYTLRLGEPHDPARELIDAVTLSAGVPSA